MTKKSRHSKLVRLGRAYQRISPLFSFADIFFRPLLRKRKGAKQATIIILAPPRSGSTLTYQLLTSAFENIHLTNIWNMLYATPVAGAMLSEKRMKKKTISTFRSEKGFVPGLTGEAEGLRFWQYWTGQGLDEAPEKIKQRRFARFSQLTERLKLHYNKPLITGYLGHSLCIDSLKKHLDNVLFVHLHRDLADNAESLHRLSPGSWLSVKPQGIDENESRERQIAKQIWHIHQKILRQAKGAAYIQVSYAEVCKSPAQLTEKIIDFAEKHSFQLRRKENKLPASFPVKENTSSPQRREEWEQMFNSLAQEKGEGTAYAAEILKFIAK